MQVLSTTITLFFEKKKSKIDTELAMSPKLIDSEFEPFSILKTCSESVGASV